MCRTRIAPARAIGAWLCSNGYRSTGCTGIIGQHGGRVKRAGSGGPIMCIAARRGAKSLNSLMCVGGGNETLPCEGRRDEGTKEGTEARRHGATKRRSGLSMLGRCLTIWGGASCKYGNAGFVRRLPRMGEESHAATKGRQESKATAKAQRAPRPQRISGAETVILCGTAAPGCVVWHRQPCR